MKRTSPVWAAWFFVLPLLLPSPSHADCHQRTTRYTVHPGVPTPLYLSVPAGAVCRLHADHHDEIGLVADADGNLRFTVEPSADENDELELVLRCDEFRQRIHLRAADHATPAAPFPPADDPALQQVPVTVLPALTDPAAYSDDDLAKAGYPLRPDATRNPSAYAVWLSAVTRPIKVIAPQTVSLPGLRHTTFTKSSGNWSGFELIPFLPDPSSDTVAPYVAVSGHWIVPQVIGELTRNTHSSLWIGLDGDSQFGASDLVQAGTEQAALPIILTPPPKLGQNPHWGVTATYAWTEVLPIEPVERVIANFPVHAGDGILTNVWVGGSGWNLPSTETTVANFQIYDSSTQMMTTVQTVIETFEWSIHYRGTTAEWVMERPGLVLNNQLVGFSDLADYQSQCIDPAGASYATTYIDATFARAQKGPAFQHQYADFDFLSQGNYDISMVNGNQLLSAAYASPDAQSICFGWFRFQ